MGPSGVELTTFDRPFQLGPLGAAARFHRERAAVRPGVANSNRSKGGGGEVALAKLDHAGANQVVGHDRDQESALAFDERTCWCVVLGLRVGQFVAEVDGDLPVPRDPVRERMVWLCVDRGT